MRTIHWSQTEIIALDNAKGYHAVIFMSKEDKGLSCDIILEDNKCSDDIIIGNILSANFDRDECYEFAYSLLSNSNYCNEVWKNHKQKGDR